MTRNLIALGVLLAAFGITARLCYVAGHTAAENNARAAQIAQTAKLEADLVAEKASSDKRVAAAALGFEHDRSELESNAAHLQSALSDARRKHPPVAACRVAADRVRLVTSAYNGVRAAADRPGIADPVHATGGTDSGQR
jgi:hypothetical protein